MYLELFKLNELPFRLSPDPQFLYLSKHHARAKAYMESTIWFTDGFVIITGEIGSGKTTLIETFLRELQKDVIVAQINQTQLSATEFLQSVLVAPLPRWSLVLGKVLGGTLIAVPGGSSASLALAAWLALLPCAQHSTAGPEPPASRAASDFGTGPW